MHIWDGIATFLACLAVMDVWFYAETSSNYSMFTVIFDRWSRIRNRYYPVRVGDTFKQRLRGYLAKLLTCRFCMAYYCGAVFVGWFWLIAAFAPQGDDVWTNWVSILMRGPLYILAMSTLLHIVANVSDMYDSYVQLLEKRAELYTMGQDSENNDDDEFEEEEDDIDDFR
jgi:hypothetical protein